MKKLIGNFDSDSFTKFQTWVKKNRFENITSRIIQDPFNPRGFIILDETTTEGKKLYDNLILKGWVEDTQYPIDIQKQKDAEQDRILREEKRKLEQKKAQDEINEKENRPNLIKNLLRIKLNKKRKAELEAMPFDKLAEHHDKIVNEKNRG